MQVLYEDIAFFNPCHALSQKWYKTGQ